MSCGLTTPDLAPSLPSFGGKIPSIPELPEPSAGLDLGIDAEIKEPTLGLAVPGIKIPSVPEVPEPSAGLDLGIDAAIKEPTLGLAAPAIKVPQVPEPPEQTATLCPFDD